MPVLQRFRPYWTNEENMSAIEGLAPPNDPVPDDGYRWWYLDATSDDGRHGLTAIVFIGSVFSPWYALARRRGPTPPLDHVAVNVALYGPKGRWTMTERGASSVRADATSLVIGPSRLDIGERSWRLSIAERGAPFARPLRGTIEIDAGPPQVPSMTLDARGEHRWQPIRPQTRLRVTMEEPSLSWEGPAYADTNRGDVPLERTFASWHWSRAHAPDGATLIRYDVVERDGRRGSRTLAIGADGTPAEVPEDVPHELDATRWFRMARPTRLRAGARASGLVTYEDAPFYSRSHFVESLGDERHSVVHESLDMDRFTHPVVQCLLPFRTPRNTRFGTAAARAPAAPAN